MIQFFAAHPTAGNLLMVVFIVLGISAAPSIQRATFPAIAPDEVEVRIAYPGAAAEDVEEAICRRVEDALDGVNEIEEVRCEAREGTATVIAEMREGEDFDRLLNAVKTEVDAIDNFPEEVEEPIIRQLGLTDFVASLAVSGPMAAADLKAYCEGLRDRMRLEGVVSQSSLQGFSDHQIRIQLPAHALRQYGLSVADVAAAVNRQSFTLPSGTLETSGRDVLLRFAEERRSPRGFEDLIVVGAESGAEIPLGDIATIVDRFEHAEERIVFNGARACLLRLTKTKAEDTLDVVEAVKAFVARERAAAPPGVHFELTQDVSSIVRDRLNLLLKNGAAGLVLVLLTLALFFNLRFAFWVALGLPIAFLGTVFAMSVLGFSFNLITMVGLLIAIGLMVDDAIVISENIATHLRRGATPLAAATQGTREVAPGVVASFLTTVMVMGSLAFMQGNIGQVLRIMPIVLILTLVVSLVEAFLVLPHHLSRAFAHADASAQPRFRRRFDEGLEWVRERVLGRAVDFAIAWRYLFVGVVVFLILASLATVVGGVLKFRVFPEIDGDAIEARILLPQGTPLARTERVVARVVAGLEPVAAHFAPRQPSGTTLIRNVNVQYNKNADAFESGPHVATVTIDLLSAETRDARVQDFLDRWRAAVGTVPDAIAITYKQFQLGPGGLPIDIRIKGEDLDVLKRAATELRDWLTGYDGVAEVTDDLRPGKPEIRLRLRDGAMALGLDSTTIAQQLRSAFFGTTASEIQVGTESYEIDVRLAPVDQDSLADLEYFAVTTPQGRHVPLGALAILESGRSYARIARIDGQRAVSLRGEIDTRRTNASEIIADTRARFLPGLERRHPGISVTFEGQASESATTGASVRRGFLFGMAGVYLLLCFLFRSYIEPLIVMAVIPTALIGVVWGHLILGLDLSMPSMIGFVSLAGIVVNNSILVVAFTKQHGRRGQPLHEAAAAASRDRFRAVLLTSLTTIAGLLPLLAERSLQAQVLIPLVVSIVFGMVTATILVLLLVPALYAILEDFGLSTFGREAPQDAPSAPLAPAE